MQDLRFLSARRTVTIKKQKGFDEVKGKIALIQVLLIFTVVMVLINVLEDSGDKSKSKSEFTDLKEQVEVIDTNTENGELSYEENGMLTKYMPLYQRNNEFSGWIEIEGTKIDYPVMQNTQTNAYYLHRNFNREDSDAGTPFLDFQCTLNPRSDNMIVYSHNMKNGEMFHDLLKYADINYYKEHNTVKFDTLYEEGEYEIFAVLRTKVGSAKEFKYYENISFKDETEFNSFVDTAIKRSLYDPGIKPQYGDKLLTLSTCSYNTDNERFVVFCKNK